MPNSHDKFVPAMQILACALCVPLPVRTVSPTHRAAQLETPHVAMPDSFVASVEDSAAVTLSLPE